MDLEAALNEFDAAETTLRRLETVWQRMTELVPQGIAFVSGSPESLEYDELRRAFRDLAAGLPTIDGWTIAELPWALDDIAQARFEARDLGELEVTVSVEQGVAAPGEAIREYRFRFNRARRGFVRHRTQKLLEEIPTLLSELQRRIEPSRAPINDPGWDVVVERFREIDRLIGPFASLTGRWNDLRRHLAFAQVSIFTTSQNTIGLQWLTIFMRLCIVSLSHYLCEWAILESLSKQNRLCQRRHGLSGRASDETFERLVFNLIRDAPGYENPLWLTKTRAPDRGRDLSVDRVVTDSLSGVTRNRVIIQCRNWLSRSISHTDVADALASMSLCEPPPVDVLVLVTSGRFTSDAVAWIERHNHARERPAIEPWADSHLESLLSQRPHLVTQFGLRPG